MRALLALALAGACWTGPVPEPSPEPPRAPRTPLYERIGGSSTIRAIVDELISNIASDVRINVHFMNADIRELRRHLADWLCVASGGPCTYSGKPLSAAHAGMRITDDAFEAFVDAFAKAAGGAGVRGRAKVELVLLVRRARAHVIER